MFELADFFVVVFLFVFLPGFSGRVGCGHSNHVDGFFQVCEVVCCESGDPNAEGFEGFFGGGFSILSGMVVSEVCCGYSGLGQC